MKFRILFPGNSRCKRHQARNKCKKYDRVFLLNDEKNLDNEAVIQKVIENPYDALVPYRLSLLSDDYFNFFRKYDALQGALYSFSKKHPVAYQKISDLVSFASKVKNHH